MEPTITAVSNERGELRFTIGNCNVSFVNAIRRTILADIEVPVLLGSEAQFEHNTTRLNNEILKQRLDCIPPHLEAASFPIEDHEVLLDVVNETGATKLITSGDFQIVHKPTGELLSKEKRDAIFPPDPISGDHILFARLRAKIAAGEDGGERLTFRCPLGKGTGASNGCYSCVSIASYGATPDKSAADAAWEAGDNEGRSKADWLALEALRYTVPDSHDFVVRSIGVLPNKRIVEEACSVLVARLQNVKERISEERDAIVQPFVGTLKNAYNVTVPGLGYTCGKAIEAVLNIAMFPSVLTFCGFRKPHPHIDESVIRIAFKDDPGERGTVETVEVLGQACDRAISVFESIRTGFA